MKTTALAALVLAAGCSSIPIRPPPVVSPDITERGATVYFGSSFALNAPATEPTFVYERRVDDTGAQRVSTHVTRDASGSIAIAEAATHSADYALADYALYANQLGQTGSIHVAKDAVTFRVDDGTGERSQTERPQGPVVVGPTVVGFVLVNLDALRAKEVIRVRFAVLDRLETIGFELMAVDGQPGQTRVKMTPSSCLFALAIDPIFFTFETATRKLVRIEGRIPPKVRAGDKWVDFDARVEYRFVATTYR